MGCDDGGSGKGLRWLEDELVCAAPGNEAKGVEDRGVFGRGTRERWKTDRKEIARREMQKWGERKKRSGRKVTRRKKKVVEETGCSRRFGNFWGSLGSLGVVVGGEDLFFSASIPTIQLFSSPVRPHFTANDYYYYYLQTSKNLSVVNRCFFFFIQSMDEAIG